MNENHGLFHGSNIEGLLHYHRFDVFEVDRSKTLAFSSDDVDDRLWPKLDLDQSLVVGVQPLMDHHGIDGQFAVLRLQFLLLDLQTSPAAILELDHAVSSAGTHDWDKAQEDTGVDVHKLVALKESNFQEIVKKIRGNLLRNSRSP